jgi:predicted dehydrogenase
VFIVTGYYEDGRVIATDLAMDVLNAGAHVWMEKPTAATVAEVDQLIELSERKNLKVMTGLKKLFFPSIEKVKEIITSPEFGQPASIYIRYPLKTPDFTERGDLAKMWELVDHIPHPGSIINYLMGKIATFSYEWEPINGGSVTQIKFTSGAVGTFHMAAGISGSSPVERLEIIGEKENVIVENGVKLAYHRKAGRGKYGRAGNYIVDQDSAPLYWEPEFSLGNLSNKNIFYLGYVGEVNYFCECVLQDKPLERGSLSQVKEITRWLEAYRTTPPGTICRLND